MSYERNYTGVVNRVWENSMNIIKGGWRVDDLAVTGFDRFLMRETGARLETARAFDVTNPSLFGVGTTVLMVTPVGWLGKGAEAVEVGSAVAKGAEAVDAATTLSKAVWLGRAISTSRKFGIVFGAIGFGGTYAITGDFEKALVSGKEGAQAGVAMVFGTEGAFLFTGSKDIYVYRADCFFGAFDWDWSNFGWYGNNDGWSLWSGNGD